MTKKRYEPNVGAVIFAPVVVSFTVAKQTLKRLHSVNEWLNTNEPELDKVVVDTLDAALGLTAAAAKTGLVASSFTEGFMEAVCEHNGIDINASRSTQVAGWKKTCKSWFEEKEEVPSLQKGSYGEVKVDFTNLLGNDKK